jgi:predicted nuclease of restriction endonuclease-like (RecB) superfamily
MTGLARAGQVVATPTKYADLVRTIDAASQQLLGHAAAAVNQALVLRNWLVGAYIVEYEQGGKDRATYGARLLETLARDLAAKGIRGLQVRMLRNCRLFYLAYPQIRQPLAAEFSPRLGLAPIRQPLSAESAPTGGDARVARGAAGPMPTPLSPALVLRLSWSKLIELVALDDPWKRAFYENECLKGNWSKRQLQRQIESLLYERTGLSRDKQAVIRRGHGQGSPETIQELVRDPYVLEFTGLAERPQYTESDLETALLDHLQSFLLELGAGFCFEARQKRITVGNEHDYLDLVFYHRLLRCHLLVDLKVRAFRHADAGQMNFYLNYWQDRMLGPGDNPPVGLILCSDRDVTKVEYATAGMDNHLFVSRYLTALPSVEQLERFIEADRARIEALTMHRRRGKPAAGTKRRTAGPAPSRRKPGTA